MIDGTEILTKLFAGDHGPSQAGISHYSAAYHCARKVRLNQAHRALAVLDTEDLEEPVQGPAMAAKPVATEVGTAYHLLMEAHIRGQLGEDIVFDARTGVFTPSQKEAIRLFRAWRSRWGSVQEKYGFQPTLVEHGLGDMEGEVTKRLGAPLTGRLDAGGVADMPAVARTFASTGCLLPSEGVVLLDWKSALTMGKNDQDVYGLGLQGIAYLWLYNLQAERNGTPKAVGIVFDKIARHKEIVEKSFAHYLVTPHPEAENILRNYVQGANALLAMSNGEGHAAAGSCVDWQSGRKCFFIDRCRRY